MVGKVTKYFAGGNTARGFYNLFAENLVGLERLFILKGGPGTGKSFLSKSIGDEWLNRGYDLEYLFCSSDEESIDGVIIPELKVGIVDGTNPHPLEPRYPGVIDDYVNLGEAWDAQKLSKEKDAIITYTKQVNAAFQSAYDAFGEALIHYEQRQNRLYSYIDQEKAETIAVELIKQLFGNDVKKGTPLVKRRFHGANTPTGAVSFMQELSSPLRQRYFLKDQYGIEKSALLQRISDAARERGFNVEIYYNGFEPTIIEMVIVRELDFAILDYAACDEPIDTTGNDVWINIEKRLFNREVTKIAQHELELYAETYAQKMQAGTEALAEAKRLRDRLEDFYIKAMDFSIAQRLREEINAEIKQMALNETTGKGQ